MVEFLHVRWEKRNGTNFYCEMLLIYTAEKYWKVLTLVWYSLENFMNI